MNWQITIQALRTYNKLWKEEMTSKIWCAAYGKRKMSWLCTVSEKRSKLGTVYMSTSSALQLIKIKMWSLLCLVQTSICLVQTSICLNSRLWRPNQPIRPPIHKSDPLLMDVLCKTPSTLRAGKCNYSCNQTW